MEFLRKLTRRIYSSVVYYLAVRHRLRRVDRTHLLGFDLEIQPTVFHPGIFVTSGILGNFLLAQELDGLKALDMGCGSGILSLCLARKGASVTAIDINPIAVQNTIKNIEINGLSNSIEVLQSDLFSGLGESETQYDIVVANPPYLDGSRSSPTDVFLRTGDDLDFFRRLTYRLSKYLSDQGRLLLILSSDARLEAIYSLFEQQGLVVQLDQVHKRYFEAYHILSIRQMSSDTRSIPSSRTEV